MLCLCLWKFVFVDFSFCGVLYLSFLAVFFCGVNPLTGFGELLSSLCICLFSCVFVSVLILKHHLKSHRQIWSTNAIARKTVTSFESKKAKMIESEKHHFQLIALFNTSFHRQWWSTNVIVGTRLTSLLMVFPCNTRLRHSNTHRHKYTNTQRHKDTKTQRHKDTKTQTHKYTNTQIHKYTFK